MCNLARDRRMDKVMPLLSPHSSPAQISRSLAKPCGISIDFGYETDRPGRWMNTSIRVQHTHTMTCLKQPFRLSGLCHCLKSVCQNSSITLQVDNRDCWITTLAIKYIHTYVNYVIMLPLNNSLKIIFMVHWFVMGGNTASSNSTPRPESQLWYYGTSVKHARDLPRELRNALQHHVTEEAKKRERDSDRVRDQTRVQNLGLAFIRWRELCKIKGCVVVRHRLSLLCSLCFFNKKTEDWM